MIKKFILAPDSFKESMTAKEVCLAMKKGILKVYPDAVCLSVPMADGGEGTMDSLVDATGGKKKLVEVAGPYFGQKVKASFGILGDKKTAIIEMAQASGLELLKVADRNPLLTSTYGTGELIKAALDEGVDKIIIGIGGSATNDGGAGMACALGANFLDESGKRLPLGAKALGQLSRIDLSTFDKRIDKVKIIIASDVSNPLCGKNGASHVFGPQKGATHEMVEQLDEGLSHYADVIARDLGEKVKDVPGSGAAGGLGAGLLAFTHAEMKLGIDIVAEETGLEDKIKTADVVFTGEGGMDFQTKFGKTPIGVSRIAKRYHKPCFALAGYIGENIEELYDEGISAIFGILSKAETLEEAMKRGSENVARTSENIARTLNLE